MFSSGFAESFSTGNHLSQPLVDVTRPTLHLHDFDDSDDSGDDMLVDDHEGSDFQSDADGKLPDLADPMTAVDDANVLVEPGNPDFDAQAQNTIATAPHSPHPTHRAAITGDKSFTTDRERFTIVVCDAAFSTYFAILYYVRILLVSNKSPVTYFVDLYR